MKILREAYAFVTGGSFSSPIGLVVAGLVAYLCLQRAASASWAAPAFLALLGIALVASVAERER